MLYNTANICFIYIAASSAYNRKRKPARHAESGRVAAVNASHDTAGGGRSGAMGHDAESLVELVATSIIIKNSFLLVHWRRSPDIPDAHAK